MATQQDAMEQVKEVVRQMIKYRFWISIGIAALFGLIAYFVGAVAGAGQGRRRDQENQGRRERRQAVHVARDSHHATTSRSSRRRPAS